MKLIDEARDVLLKAWSVRLILLSAALSGIEAALPSLTDAFPPKTFAILSGAVAFAALIARVVAQPDSLPKKDGDASK